MVVDVLSRAVGSLGVVGVVWVEGAVDETLSRIDGSIGVVGVDV